MLFCDCVWLGTEKVPNQNYHIFVDNPNIWLHLICMCFCVYLTNAFENDFTVYVIEVPDDLDLEADPGAEKTE